MEYKKHKFNFFPEIDNENYQELKQSISKGFDETLGKITLFENEILDGWNRYRACIECNITPVFTEFKGSNEDAFDFSIKANQKRRHLTSSQLTTIALRAEPLWQEIQKKVEDERIEKIRMARQKQESEKRELERKELERKQELVRQENERIKREKELKERLQRESDLQKQKDIEAEQLRIKKERETAERVERERIKNEKKEKEMSQLIVTSDNRSDRNDNGVNSKLAEVFNTNRSYISDAKKIKETAPEIYKKIETGEISIPEAKKQIAKETFIANNEKQKKEIAENKLPELNGLYDIISVDPPWNYGREYDPENSRVANPYPEMSVNEIKDLKLPFTDNAIIFLWTTHKFLPEAFEILKTWGFEYKATLVWNKEKIGMGAWFRMQCEFCLFAIKGKPFWNNTTERDIIIESRREHSRKPDSFFEMVNKICVGRKLEYFAREKRDGWDIFGNDTNKF